MTKEKCLYCGGSICLLFEPNKSNKKLDLKLFACTNCGFGKHGTIVQCEKCGIAYVSDPITQEEISNFYRLSEDETYLEEQNAREWTFKLYLWKLNRHLSKKKGKLLDIGTNTGLFVKLALEDGFDAVGLEPNKEAVNFAKKKYNLNLINKPFEKNTFPDKSFDVVSMWDVIEHFTDPVSEMEKVYKCLKPGGVFVFSTIDHESLAAKAAGTNWPWFMEMHRVFLSKNTSEYYLKKTGFNRVEFSPHWRFLSLGYSATRFRAVSYTLGNLAKKLGGIIGINKFLIPYYANDLYDCYAFKD